MANPHHSRQSYGGPGNRPRLHSPASAATIVTRRVAATNAHISGRKTDLVCVSVCVKASMAAEIWV